ncbi:ABC transporter ATP-binding protein [Amycolatopsis endophytica]|uniref:Oligopeptide/dipeptide ABC transporter ATP-binding protein n=1 Tax=Amycolatopsis endophytica TaxID=860233 RepID=A0A853AWW9_9PSEU|nr:ABC transporter ATP-binding protein [Amycolatopsis endophytica]NYI87190.1 oligopeptide/dipeptide ABC transporter ATP-binding protein [Amycolatopsis endophytica]
MTPVLEVEDLTVSYGAVRALDGAALTVARGETVGVVGESGSGKSTLGSAVGGLLPRSARIDGGTVRIDGADVHRLRPKELRTVRRERLGFVFQEPIGSLDPTMRVGKQMALVLGSRDGVLEHLARVRLTDPERVARSYPHQLSGGMAQRVAIAMAMASSPDILVADEPTAALDSQVREDVLNVIFTLAAEAGTTILWLSHDLPAVAKRCSHVVVMYGGRVVESGAAAPVLAQPRHPYTAALVRAVPAAASDGQRLEPIPGQPPVLTGASAGCAFSPRCLQALETCGTHRPPLVSVDERDVLCHLAGAGR